MIKTTIFHQSMIGGRGGICCAQEPPIDWWNIECQEPPPSRIQPKYATSLRLVVLDKFLKNKKADFIGLNVLYHILEILFIITVGVFVFFIVHVEKDIDTFPIESEILFNRILYSNNGLWFYDEEIDRLYPGILELENFDNKEKIEKSLNRSIHYGDENKRAAAQLILKENETEFNPVYYNEEKYKEWIEQYKAGWTVGAGGKKGKNKKINVLIKKDESLVPGILDITVLIPNK